jgi:hypothetical protein
VLYEHQRVKEEAFGVQVSLKFLAAAASRNNYNMQLEWSEHPRRLVEGVLQLHNAAAFHDVTLSAEGKHIKAHRVILAAASTYFKVHMHSLCFYVYL